MLSVKLTALLLVCAPRALQDDLVLVEPETTIKAHDGITFHIALSQSTMLVVGGLDRPTKIWDLKTRKDTQTFNNSFSPQFLPSGASFVGLFGRLDKERRVGLWDVQECDIKTGDTKVLYAATDAETPIALWPDRKLAVSRLMVGDQHVLKFIDYEKKSETRFVQTEPFKVLGFSPDKKRLALRYANGKMRVFDWERPKKICEFVTGDDEDPFKPRKLWNWYFSADGKNGYAHVTVFERGFLVYRLEKWDLEKGTLKKTWEPSGYLGTRSPAAMTPDHRHLISALGQSVIAINLDTGAEKVVGIKDPRRGDATAISISPDGQRVAIGYSEGYVRILPVAKVIP